MPYRPRLSLFDGALERHDTELRAQFGDDAVNAMRAALEVAMTKDNPDDCLFAMRGAPEIVASKLFRLLRAEEFMLRQGYRRLPNGSWTK